MKSAKRSANILLVLGIVMGVSTMMNKGKKSGAAEAYEY